MRMCVEGEEGESHIVHNISMLVVKMIHTSKPSEMTTCSLGLCFCRMTHFAGNFRVKYFYNVMHRLG